MKVLVLGGTKFVGRAVVDAALGAGADVTLFHRGRTNPELFPDARHVIGDRDGGLEALADGSWDACIDVSGYVPRIVRASSTALCGRVGRYVFVSTISVYSDLSVPRDEEGPLASLDDPSTEEITGERYGALKVLCERAVAEVLGDDGSVVRPGYVIGPWDHTGRFPWWAHRAAKGGSVVVPASMAHRFQAIDARDLASFLLTVANEPTSATYNATGPVPPVTLVELLREAASQRGAELDLELADDAFLTERGLTGAELPLWINDAAWRAWAELDVSRALDAGLRFRPAADTVAATLAATTPIDGVGLSPGREEELLAAWRSRRDG